MTDGAVSEMLFKAFDSTRGYVILRLHSTIRRRIALFLSGRHLLAGGAVFVDDLCPDFFYLPSYL
jgi:hypothetical protein